jgi:hypothetical protein
MKMLATTTIWAVVAVMAAQAKNADKQLPLITAYVHLAFGDV